MSKKLGKAKIIFGTVVFFAFCLADFARAASVGEKLLFYVDENHVLESQEKIEAILIKESPNIYFYVEKAWWNLQDSYKKEDLSLVLDNLADEFSGKIYPVLTSTFGQEWKPGIDKDAKITIFFHQMRGGATGYFRSNDEYSKLQVPNSNEREMIYLNTANIEDPQLKSFLAHEFFHLISFNQKERLMEAQEDVWLSEAMAEYAITLLGYNATYMGSNLQKRLTDFMQYPFDSLTEWQSRRYDYASANMFVHYLVEHYGIGILTESMKLKSAGITSIDEALKIKGFKEDFSQVFTDWTIASLINDCTKDIKYCYLSQNFQGLKVNPTLNFLPVSSSSLSVTNATKNWSGNWQKIIGGNGHLTLKFSSLNNALFKVPYLVFDKSGNYTLDFVNFDNNKIGEIEIEKFGEQYASLIIIPSPQVIIENSGVTRPSYIYNFEITVIEQPSDEKNRNLIQALLAKIDNLKKIIADLQAGFAIAGLSQSPLLNESDSDNSNSNLCNEISNSLYIGLEGDRVRCLQQFLKSQGQEIYPDGLVTGYFGNLTKNAVAKFQEKYKEEILVPLGLSSGTGYVGPSTRAKINTFIK